MSLKRLSDSRILPRMLVRVVRPKLRSDDFGVQSWKIWIPVECLFFFRRPRTDNGTRQPPSWYSPFGKCTIMYHCLQTYGLVDIIIWRDVHIVWKWFYQSSVVPTYSISLQIFRATSYEHHVHVLSSLVRSGAVLFHFSPLSLCPRAKTASYSKSNKWNNSIVSSKVNCCVPLNHFRPWNVMHIGIIFIVLWKIGPKVQNIKRVSRNFCSFSVLTLAGVYPLDFKRAARGN